MALYENVSYPIAACVRPCYPTVISDRSYLFMVDRQCFLRYKVSSSISFPDAEHFPDDKVSTGRKGHIPVDSSREKWQDTELRHISLNCTIHARKIVIQIFNKNMIMGRRGLESDRPGRSRQWRADAGVSPLAAARGRRVWAVVLVRAGRLGVADLVVVGERRRRLEFVPEVEPTRLGARDRVRRGAAPRHVVAVRREVRRGVAVADTVDGGGRHAGAGAGVDRRRHVQLTRALGARRRLSKWRDRSGVPPWRWRRGLQEFGRVNCKRERSRVGRVDSRVAVRR